jgi:hypothetical protein
MKTGAFILSFLFVIMSIQPMFIKWNSGISCTDKETPKKTVLPAAACKKTCSTAEKPPVNKPVEQKNEKPCNTCNPFMVCNGCAYIPEEAHKLVSPGGDKIENTNWFNDESLSSFGADCWHPPELFMHL